MFDSDVLGEIVGNVTLFNVFVCLLISFLLITLLLTIISIWILFTKANKINWSLLIPGWNIWVWFEVCGIKGYLCLIPIVNIVFLFISIFKLPLSFNRKAIYGLGILFVPYLFLARLAFDKNLNYIKLETNKKQKTKKKKKNENKTKEKVEVLDLDGTTTEVIEVFVES